MSRGRKPTPDGPTERVLAVLRALGRDKGFRPVSIRSAELAERAKVNHGSLSALGQQLVERGLVTRCKVQPAKGNATYEYRLGSGMVQPEFHPLNTKRAGIAIGQPMKPLPVTTPAAPFPPPPVLRGAADIEVPQLPAKKHTRAGEPDPEISILERVQSMDENEFANYLRHLAHVWSWGRARKIVGGIVGAAA